MVINKTDTVTVKLQKAINKATATVTNDYEDQRTELRHPEHIRTTIRFSLTLAMVTVLMVAIVYLVQSQPNTKLSRETYKGIKDLRGFSPLLSGTLRDENIDGGLVAIPVQCPCSRQTFSWNNFTEIFSISKDSNDHLMKNLLNRDGKYPDMCKIDGEFTLPLSPICLSQLQAYIGYKDQRTFIQSTNLLPPMDVQNEVYIQMKTNFLLQEDTSQYLEDISRYIAVSPELGVEYIYSRYISALIGAMIVQQWNNTSSSIKDFWERGTATIANFSNVQVNTEIVHFNTEIALGMTISWDAYEEMCHPDHIDPYPLVAKIFHATSEVGGFLSIVLFIVRAIIWPILLSIFAPTQKGLEASNLPPTPL